MSARDLLGVVFYAGPSILDGAPVVGILTLRESSNRKTGDMAQAWILAQGADPVAAQRTGADSSVCGSCVLRPALVRLARERGETIPRCYVNTGQAPLAVWRAWTRGAYARADAIDPARLRAALGGRAIRWGAYGDPSAIPQHAWLDLHTRCGAPDHTAYTHAWRDPRAAWLRAWAMASADDAQGLQDARSAGWRAFRVRRASEPLAPREVACPAESGRAQCADCTLCDGSRGVDDRRASIAIVAHGAGTPAEWLAGGDA